MLAKHKADSSSLSWHANYDVWQGRSAQRCPYHAEAVVMAFASTLSGANYRLGDPGMQPGIYTVVEY